jgi:hypothetical protein
MMALYVQTTLVHLRNRSADARRHIVCTYAGPANVVSVQTPQAAAVTLGQTEIDMELIAAADLGNAAAVQSLCITPLDLSRSAIFNRWGSNSTADWT